MIRAEGHSLRESMSEPLVAGVRPQTHPDTTIGKDAPAASGAYRPRRLPRRRVLLV